LVFYLIDFFDMESRKEVSAHLYDREYFLRDNEGWREYERGLENHIHPRYNRALEIADVSQGESVLDVGCGRGELIYYCAKRGVKVLGLDYSQSAVDIAQETIRKLPQNLQHLVKVEIGDVVKYNFQEKYDIVFMIEILEHMYDWQLVKVFGKINQILKDDGRVIIMTPNFHYEKYLRPIKMFINIPGNLFKWPLRIIRGKYKPKNLTDFLDKIFRMKISRGEFLEKMHVNVLTPRKIINLLSDFDMQIHCEDHSINPISLITQKWWGREIIAVARKKTINS